MHRRPMLALLALGQFVVLSPAGPVGAGEPVGDRVSPRNFLGDTYSVSLKLGGLIDGTFQCRAPHHSGEGDNIVTFDGETEHLGPFTNGTQPLVTEFLVDSRARRVERILFGIAEAWFLVTGERLGSDDEDLVPGGFEDPDTGTPLTDACIEIGSDDKLDGDPPVQVDAATIEFMRNDGSNFGGPIDITSAFRGNPWNGRGKIGIPHLAGANIVQILLILEGRSELSDEAEEIFRDTFESGDTSEWSDEVP